MIPETLVRYQQVNPEIPEIWTSRYAETLKLTELSGTLISSGNFIRF